MYPLKIPIFSEYSTSIIDYFKTVENLQRALHNLSDRKDRACYTIVYMTKIAIIEDDPVINQMYRMKFEADGFEIQVADNGRSGVELVQTYQPDMVLLDLQMPEMTGDEALQHIRAADWGKDVPVIILTNTGAEEAPKVLDELNVHSYIVKAELTPSEVVARVKDALGLA